MPGGARRHGAVGRGKAAGLPIRRCRFDSGRRRHRQPGETGRTERGVESMEDWKEYAKRRLRNDERLAVMEMDMLSRSFAAAMAEPAA